MQETILILDFGSQYTQLIARRVREMHVYSELHSHDMSEEEIKAFNPKGIILSGGPNSVYESDTPMAPQIGFELGIAAFTAAVLGGIGNIRGAFAGGLALGLIEMYSSAVFGTQWKSITAFVILVLVLLF